MITFALTSVTSLLCRASTYFRIGSHGDSLFRPIDVLQTQTTDFANAQAVDRAKQDRAATSDLNWRRTVDGGKKLFHLFLANAFAGDGERRTKLFQRVLRIVLQTKAHPHYLFFARCQGVQHERGLLLQVPEAAPHSASTF